MQPIQIKPGVNSNKPCLDKKIYNWWLSLQLLYKQNTNQSKPSFFPVNPKMLIQYFPLCKQRENKHKRGGRNLVILDHHTGTKTLLDIDMAGTTIHLG